MRTWERARKLARNPSHGGRIRPEPRIRLGTEPATNSESGVDVDVDSEALKDSIAKKDSDAGLGACSDVRSESESRRLKSARAQNQARYGISNGFGFGRRRRLRDSKRLDCKERFTCGPGSLLGSSLGIRVTEVGFGPSSESGSVRNQQRIRIRT